MSESILEKQKLMVDMNESVLERKAFVVDLEAKIKAYESAMQSDQDSVKVKG
jgi:hypothetical protein